MRGASPKIAARYLEDDAECEGVPFITACVPCEGAGDSV
jgi:hypothetical protein